MKQLRGQLEEERTRRDRPDWGGNYDECRSRTRGWSEEEMLEERIASTCISWNTGGNCMFKHRCSVTEGGEIC